LVHSVQHCSVVMESVVERIGAGITPAELVPHLKVVVDSLESRFPSLALILIHVSRSRRQWCLRLFS